MGETVLETHTGDTMASNSTYEDIFEYTPTVAGKVTITVEVLMDGNIYTQNVELDVRDADKLVYVGIDASNYNEYVDGNYKDSMGNFADLAVGYDVRVVELKTEEDLIAATENDKFVMLILTPPTRRDGSSLFEDYQNWSDAEIEAIANFAEKGKTVIVTGWGDYYESYESDTSIFPSEDHMASQQNKILEALGASLRISDDELKDDVTTNGGQPQRLYLTEINEGNMFMQGIVDSQVYSNYGGSTIYAVGQDGMPTSALPESASAMVYGFTTSYSADDDADNYAGVTIPKYDGKYLSAASETITYDNGNTATIIVAGSVFMSNFEIQGTADNYGTPAYSNYTIVENLMKFINPVQLSYISEVKDGATGEEFTVRGVLTTNASGYDKETAFFDSAYMQDATGGINLFPVSGEFKAGDMVEVSGEVSSYQDEIQLKVSAIAKIGEGTVPAPIDATAEQINDKSVLGSLVKVSGEITRIVETNGLPESIYFRDASGEEARIFIDGYITTDKEIANLEVGATVTAIGLSSFDNTYADINARIRISDRANITATPEQTGGSGGGGGSSNNDDDEIDIGDDETPLASFTDISTDNWYFEAVNFVVEKGLFLGTSELTFEPESEMTRAMMWTVLARMDGIDTKTDGVWYEIAQEWVISEGISNGDNPDSSITREEFVTMLYRYAGSPELTASQLEYPDVAELSDWAFDGMVWATLNGIIEGDENKNLNPTDTATRSEISAMIMRYLNLVTE